MLQPSFKSVFEDSYRNKYFLYYSGTSVCCKIVFRDGASRDTIIASQVNDNFLATIDLQDRIYVACQSKEKGIYIFAFYNGSWKVEQILNVQGNDIILLSLFSINEALHLIYAKQMAVANFYNVIHLFKANKADSTWRKYSICEMYAEDPNASYSVIMSREGFIHLVCEWFDGNNYQINYFIFGSPDNPWKKKTITSLFKKDIVLNLLYEESIIHLLCYTYEDDSSAIFYYTKKDGTGKDFEFNSLDKINTTARVSPSFHIEGSIIYASWIYENKFYQYSLGKEQKNWAKKINSTIPKNEIIQLVEYIRNRKGRHWIIKNTYFNIDYKYNINLPYFRDVDTDEAGGEGWDEKTAGRNADGDLVRYIPYLIEEVSTLSQMVKTLTERLEQLEAKKTISYDFKPSNAAIKNTIEPQRERKEVIKLKKSNFKDDFLKSNKLLSRPEATAMFMGPGSIPNPNELSKKDEIKFADNIASSPPAPKPKTEVKEDSSESPVQITDNDATLIKDGNLFKKIGDFFK